MKAEEIKAQILDLTEEYYKEVFAKETDFAPGDRIGYSGRIFNEKDMKNLVSSALEFWLTSGHYTEEFEKKLSEYLGVKYCSMVNSGSSANLAAFMALTAEELGERRIVPGDEVITVAAGFPTTVAPIVQYGAVPVFLDVTVREGNIDVSKLEEAVTDKTKAVVLAHTLGNTFDIALVKTICEKYRLWLIEDNCDALGSEYQYQGEWKKTGSFGDISTCSFYPPHHITTGEGGAVCTNDIKLHRLINSFRDWGRECWCKPGVDNTCKQRYTGQFGEMPKGYDHKYIYSHFGYNLKATDLQASVGCSQIEKLPGFVEKRRENWSYLYAGLKSLEDVLMLPEKTPNSNPSWFGFLMSVQEGCGYTRDGLADYLERHNIQTRYLFAGNLIKQPCFNEMRNKKQGYRVVGKLDNTDFIMTHSLWIGVYPGMNKAKLDYMIACIYAYFKRECPSTPS